MTNEDLKAAVVSAITKVAPEVDPADIRPGVRLRDALDLDSMDFLNVVLALHDALGVDIPEADYPQFATLDLAVAYLGRKLGAL